MKVVSSLALAVALIWVGPLSAEVTITNRDDCLRVQSDGRLVTEWRHNDWAAPFLYPVIGPNGESVTRHFPIKSGVPGEEQDHPHHRSLRFSHSDVNGFNFWWAPGKEKAGHTAEIKLEKIERITNGKTGEVVLWNQWLGDGKLVLREKVRLTFIPLEDRQLLLDYDIELHAADVPVVFGDKRDGGLLVRVANTMKVESEKGEKGEGSMINSRDDRNADAWGQRAEWTDYYGPDASGKIIGIAMFDHPSNLRFPTHWHARTYGLLTANRFGTDHFKGNYEDHKTVVCRPHGDACSACESHSGDYTIPAGESVTLRHRIFIHHGDPKTAQVAERYHDYASGPDATVLRLRALARDRRWKEIVEQFERDDFGAWPAEFAQQSGEAYSHRGQARAALKSGALAEADLIAATKLTPKNPLVWMSLGDNYANNLADESRALAAYRESLAITGPTQGWQPLTTTLSIVRILTDQVKTDEALAILRTYDELKSVAPVWRVRLLRAYGHVYAAQGNEKEALAKFREALELEANP